jgi:hypothetical protein
MRAAVHTQYGLPLLPVMLTLVSVGCSTVVPVEGRFPSPLIEPLPVTVGVRYGNRFRAYEYRPNEESWVVPLGSANVRLFNRMFTAMFERAVPVKSQASAAATSSQLDAVIQPTIEGYNIITPTESNSRFYQVSVEYLINLYTRDGERLARWPLMGTGRSPSKTMRAAKCVAEATSLAMRDAAARLVINFRRVPRIKRWLQLADAREDNRNVKTSRKQRPAG